MSGYVQTARSAGERPAASAERRTGALDHGPAWDAGGAALNRSPRAQSLMQLRAALDESPRVQALQGLTRALNRTHHEEHDEPEQAPHDVRAPMQFVAMPDDAGKPNDPPPAEKKPNATGLPDRLKAGVEQLSGLALDDVRVHYNSQKPAAVQAHAYAQGTDIHVAPGQEQHLPHEAWHVVQQKQARVKPTLQAKGVAINDDTGLEREADLMGGLAVRRRSSGVLQAIGLWAATAQAAVLQRVATQIVADPMTNVITEVLIGGRPESSFSGTMGDHTTAFAVQAESVRSRLLGNAPMAALQQLQILYQETSNLPGMQLRGDLPEAHSSMLTDAQERVETLLGPQNDEERKENLDSEDSNLDMDLKQAGKEGNSSLTMDAKEDVNDEEFDLAALHLQECVNAYLAFRELVPLSAVNIKAKSPALAGKGKGESGALNTLRALEATYKNAAADTSVEAADEMKSDMTSETDLLNNAVLSLFDGSGVAHAAIETDNRLLDQMAPGLLPDIAFDETTISVFDEQTIWDRIVWYARQHLASIASAFPNATHAIGLPSPEDIATHVYVDHALPHLREDRNAYLDDARSLADQELGRIQSRLLERKSATRILGASRDASERAHSLYLVHDATIRKINGVLGDTVDAPAWPELQPSIEETTGTRKSARYKERETKVTTIEKTKGNLKRKHDDERDTKAELKISDEEALAIAQQEEEEAAEREDAEALAADQNLRTRLRQTLVIQISVKNGKIDDVMSEGRPRSPFSGTMGAHTTAWTLHLDNIRLSLRGKTIAAAHDKLIALADQAIIKAAGSRQEMKLADDDAQVVQQRNNLNSADAQLKECRSRPATALSLQQFISTLLTLINLTPGATREAADTGGKAEGHARGVLRKPQQHDLAKIRWAVFRLLDVSGVDDEDEKKAELADHLAGVKELYQEAWEKSAIEQMDDEQRYEEAMSVWEGSDYGAKGKDNGTKGRKKKTMVANTKERKEREEKQQTDTPAFALDAFSYNLATDSNSRPNRNNSNLNTNLGSDSVSNRDIRNINNPHYNIDADLEQHDKMSSDQ